MVSGRRFVMCCLVLLGAFCSLWAFPGRVTGLQDPQPGATQAVEVLQEVQRSGSGTTQDDILPTLQESSVEEALDDLMAAEANLDALEEASLAKDGVIDSLAAENAALASDAREAGSKAFVLLDGILGFDNGVPRYGAGLALGVRIGDSLMLHAGADMMLSVPLRIGLDSFTFRAGLGWMF